MNKQAAARALASIEKIIKAREGKRERLLTEAPQNLDNIVAVSREVARLDGELTVVRAVLEGLEYYAGLDVPDAALLRCAIDGARTNPPSSSVDAAAFAEGQRIGLWTAISIIEMWTV